MSVRPALPRRLSRRTVLDKPFSYTAITSGELISRCRKEKKMSQAEFAAEVGISRNYLSMLERNKTTNLSVKILVSLGNAMNVDAFVLLSLYAKPHP